MIKLQGKALISIAENFSDDTLLKKWGSRTIQYRASARAIVTRLSAHKFSFVGQDFLKCHLWAEGTVK